MGTAAAAVRMLRFPTAMLWRAGPAMLLMVRNPAGADVGVTSKRVRGGMHAASEPAAAAESMSLRRLPRGPPGRMVPSMQAGSRCMLPAGCGTAARPVRQLRHV